MSMNPSPFPTGRRQFCAAGALLLAGCAGTAIRPPADAIAQLGSTGTLRAAINFGNPILANRGPAGEPTGVSVDLAREAAHWLDAHAGRDRVLIVPGARAPTYNWGRTSDEVIQALADYVRNGDAEASVTLDRFIERNKVYIRRMSPAQMRKRLRLEPVGQHHDLGRIYERLNERYFRGRIDAAITFGPAPRVTRPRKSIKMGSYSADSRVIRIHPALDQPVVPRYFVEWIVFHEMLHHVYRTRRGEDGRRCIHPPEFLEHERRFHDYARAQAWELDNLDLLLRARVSA